MSGGEVLVGLFWAAMTGWGGYMIGQTREWSRVLRYLNQHEHTKTASWITIGIVMDDHHKRRRKAPTEEDPK